MLKVFLFLYFLFASMQGLEAVERLSLGALIPISGEEFSEVVSYSSARPHAYAVSGDFVEYRTESGFNNYYSWIMQCTRKGRVDQKNGVDTLKMYMGENIISTSQMWCEADGDNLRVMFETLSEEGALPAKELACFPDLAQEPYYFYYKIRSAPGESMGCARSICVESNIVVGDHDFLLNTQKGFMVYAYRFVLFQVLKFSKKFFQTTADKFYQVLQQSPRRRDYERLN